MNKTSKPIEMSDGDSFWIGAGGDVWARTMDVSERNFATMSQALMAAAAPQPGERVLDVGCGGGVTSRVLAQQVLPGGDVVGMDISPTLLESAQQHHGEVDNLSFKLADVGAEALPAEHFDLIYSRFGVMFFNKPPAAFANLRQSLKPGGRMVFMCWRGIKDNPWIYQTTAAAVAQLPEEHRPPAPADPFAPGPFAMADPDHTRALITAGGFSDVTIEPLDDVMRMTDEQTAMTYLLDLGPVGKALQQVSADQANSAREAMREVLRSYATPGELNVPSATWIVTARR